jgi:hypothetical protein
MVRLCAWVAAFLLVLVSAAWAEEKKAEFDKDFPPRVVKTEPADREKDVDSGLKEIKVTFDRPMMTEKNNWAWMTAVKNGVFPGSRNLPAPRWEDGGRTCVLPVKLSPDTLYAVGCNSPRDWGFSSSDGKPAVPFYWVFKTKK